MSLLDILIPHYEDVEGLSLSLASIESQTWRGNPRIVICDDGSSHQTLDMLETIIGNHQNIVLIKNENNIGRARTRNVLLDAIESSYTAWLDAGDEWYPQKIKMQFDSLYRAIYRQNGSPVWSTCNYDWQWNFGRKRKRQQEINDDQMKNLLVGQKLRSYLWTILAESHTFKDVGYFDEKLPRLQDLDYFIRFVSNGGLLIKPRTELPLCVYHKSDIGRDAKEIHGCYNYIYRKHSHVYGTFSSKFRKNRKYDIEIHSARFAQNNNDPATTCRMLVKAACVNPSRFIYSVVKNKGVKL
ncbi:glycosyltransferase family 2 protein [Salinicola lusitanus]|uniref:Glycosyltransferase family 2 protein n=1 Tax=Salinicola lusitanus TaxID=1949085 RepID=A0ABZ3CPN6_9GAMM